MRCSVIIPTLNEAEVIEQALERVSALQAHEIVVGDGGSTDRTREIARRYATVVSGPRGRGSQLNAAAAHATGDTFLFLHADVRLPDDALGAIEAALTDNRAAGGHFTVRFGAGPHEVFVAAVYDLLRRTGIVYGDSCIFARREVFQRLGGYRDYPIMEDVNFVSRMRGVGRVVALPQTVLPSARRWRRGGRLRTWASWWAIQALYGAGVSPRWLGRLYQHVR